MPAATVAAALLLGLKGPALTTALLFQALPTASSAYIMARQRGGDAPLMAVITAIQTALALAATSLVLLTYSHVDVVVPASYRSRKSANHQFNVDQRFQLKYTRLRTPTWPPRIHTG